MKVNKKFPIWASLALGALLAACSNKEISTNEVKGKIDLTESLTFNIESEDYQSTPVKGMSSAKRTRAETATEEPETIDLGNGLIAEFTIEPDTVQPTPQTRAQMSDGHYKIYVINSAGVRLTGTDESISGTVSGGVFTADAHKKMMIAPGNYTFVCINDAVIDNGTSLTVKKDANNPMIGTVSAHIADGTRKYLSFTMRHMLARLRVQITSYTAPATSATFNASSDSGLYGDETFDLKGVSLGKGISTLNIDNILLKPVTPVVYSSIVQPYKTVTDDFYFTGGFRTMDIMSSQLKGTLHGKTFTLNVHTRFNDLNLILQKNHSYIFNFTIKTKDQLYLYNDGTVGYLGDKTATRVPIGVVARKKSTGEHGIAVALKDAANTGCAYTTPYNAGKMNIQHNTTHYTDNNDAANDLYGYKWTYDPDGSVDKRIKANFSADYTPFYQAAQYNPGTSVTGSNVSKWYVPALGEWYVAWKSLGSWDGTLTSPLSVNIAAINKTFTDAGGTALRNSDYWNSTEFSGLMRPTVYITPTSIYLGSNATHNLTGFVRPFATF